MSGAIFFFIIFVFVFFFLLRNHLLKGAFVFPFLVLKESSGALNHLFQSIAFELTISGRFCAKVTQAHCVTGVNRENI